jgi:hypothetical protein
LLIASICSAAPAQLGPDAPRGFEINKGGHHAGSPPGGYFSPYKNPALADGPPGESLPIRLGEETADFILTHADAPFFAFLAFYSVHGPIQTTQALWQKYRDKAVCLSHSLSLSLSLCHKSRDRTGGWKREQHRYSGDAALHLGPAACSADGARLPDICRDG